MIGGPSLVEAAVAVDWCLETTDPGAFGRAHSRTRDRDTARGRPSPSMMKSCKPPNHAPRSSHGHLVLGSEFISIHPCSAPSSAMPSSPHSQTRISSFFSQPSSSSSPLRKSHSKRAASPIEIDLTVDSGDDDVGTSHILKPAVKKRKLTALPHRPTSSPSHASSSTINTAEQWRFDPSLASPTKQEFIETSSFSANSPVKEHAPETLALKKQRREAFQKKLLLDNNPFLKRKDVSMSSLGDTLEVDSDAGPGDGETSGNSGDDSDEAFKKLTEMFSNKTQGKAKGKAKAKAPPKAKVVEPLGPSGKSYTPLEKQVIYVTIYLYSIGI